ncbi:urease accessory protein UreD [uncultured Roseobacter sp.]|uniref:urease accessory protein UreD n=1 Tax=uncultured Roseobacter sp. TaxID=114847 RepID=UPI0026165057|nr:urease accessory protein UreD [uncultured Roseobacter sp.]
MQPATLLDQPRAIGSALVSSKLRDGRSYIDGLRQSGALKLLFPRNNDLLETTLINTAGGITGGDRFEVAATATNGSNLTLTTQAAERAYRAQAGQIGRIKTRLTVEDGARLNWLPQETILYEASAISRRLDVEVADQGRFLMVEPVLFGRQAMGEEPRSILFRDRVAIRRAGTLIYRDGVTFDGDAAAALDRPAIGSGARAMANLVMVAPEAEGLLPMIRETFGVTGGASLLANGLLVARLLASDGFELRQRLIPVLDQLTHHKLPANWRL